MTQEIVKSIEKIIGKYTVEPFEVSVSVDLGGINMYHMLFKDNGNSFHASFSLDPSYDSPSALATLLEQVNRAFQRHFNWNG